VTENFMLLEGLQQYSEYCFEVDSYPASGDGYWSQSVEYCASTGERGKHNAALYLCIYVFIYLDRPYSFSSLYKVIIT